MSKRLILILTLALVAGLTCAAYAEVQNVKVSGDITVMGVGRDNFDLTKRVEPMSVVATDADTYDDKERDFLSITRVRVDADLTDNVSATVRLLNERNWNGDSDTYGWSNTNIGNHSRGTSGTSNSIIANQNSASENGIDLDLAYVTLKEFLYSPLSLTIGRQELRFGNGLVVGDPDTNIWSARTALAEGDLSARKSFDALRATLDYNPLVVDVIYAKVQEADVNLNDDITLSGINASYALNNNTTLEGFLFNKVKGTRAAAVYNIDATNATAIVNGDANQRLKDESDIVNTIGIRATDKTVKNLSLDGQIAYQFGRYNPKFDPNARYGAAASVPNRMAETSRRDAMAIQISGAYDLKDVAMIGKYSPMISAGYTYLSGADRDKTDDKAYKGWDPMFEDQTNGHIMNAIFANTNAHKMNIGLKAKATEDITAKLDYIALWLDHSISKNRNAVLSGIASSTATGRVYRMGGEKYLGQEIDLTLTYDYTEDVQFGLLGGILVPHENNICGELEHDTTKGVSAGELIASMKVTF